MDLMDVIDLMIGLNRYPGAPRFHLPEAFHVLNQHIILRVTAKSSVSYPPKISDHPIADATPSRHLLLFISYTSDIGLGEDRRLPYFLYEFIQYTFFSFSI